MQSKLWAFGIGGSLALGYAAYKRSQQPQSKPGSIDGFTKYTLLDKDDISSTCSIFTIAPLTGQKSTIDQKAHPRSIQSVLLKQPDLQIARSYTILPPLQDQADDTIRLLIRRENKGEVSGYLHETPVGSDVEVRGPYVDLTLPNDTTNIIFLAGGTGVAPALKTADLLQSTATVHVLWASRKAEDCSGATSDHPTSAITSNARTLFGLLGTPAVSQEKNTLVLLFDLLKLQAANQKKELTVDYFVDEQQTYMRPREVAKLLRSVTEQEGNKLIIVSGPDGFVHYWAGAKEYVNGQLEQGKLGGVLSKIDLSGWQVVKL